MSSVPASAFLALALILFCIGLYGALTKRNTVIVLISIELMLNAVNINLVTFSKYGIAPSITGQIFALFAISCGSSRSSGRTCDPDFALPQPQNRQHRRNEYNEKLETSVIVWIRTTKRHLMQSVHLDRQTLVSVHEGYTDTIRSLNQLTTISTRLNSCSRTFYLGSVLKRG